MLQEVLNKIFVIPISDAEIDVIQKITDAYMADMETEQLELCGEVYFERSRIDEFQKQLEAISSEEDLTMPQLPNLAYVGLAEYILCSVVKDEEQADGFRFLTSLYIRNYLVCQKYDNFLFNPKLLVDTFEYANNYLTGKVTFGEVQNSLKPAIFKANNWKDVLGESTSVTQEHFMEIKQFAMKAEKYDFEQSKSLITKSLDKSKYQQAFDVAYRLSHASEWIRVDEAPKNTIKNIIGKSERQKVLSAFNLDLSSYEIENIQSNSSILLRYLFNGGVKGERIGLAKFTAAEFAVYLYYEFLLEKFLVEYGK